MAFLFNKQKKTPEELVAGLHKCLDDISTHRTGSAGEKLQADILKKVAEMKLIVYGEPGAPSSSTPVSSGSSGSGDAAEGDHIKELARSMCAHEILPQMLLHFKMVDFEVRKGIAMICCYFVRNDVMGFASDYMNRHTALLVQMVDGYSSPDLALHCGTMLRECIKVPRLHESLLYGPDGGISKPIQDIFEVYVHDPNFEVAADAFDTLANLLTSNQALVFAWLDPDGGPASHARCIDLFAMYSKMLTSENYVLKRQSLKLLSEFLLEKTNFHIMLHYIQDKNHLKTIMMMLRHAQPNIQLEAFHVFKVFAANPDKPKEIAEILAANKGKLIHFLQTFQNENDEEQFTEEKAILIETLNRLHG